MRNLIKLLPLLFLCGCSRAEGKALFDFLQYLLNQDPWLRWIVCILLVYLLFQSFRVLRLGFTALFRAAKKSYRFVFVWGRRRWILLLASGTLLWAFSNPLIDLLQDIEQRFFYPVYVNEYSAYSEEHLTAIFEAELSKKVDPYHRQVIIRRTREIAAQIQSTPLAIYEAAYLECGLNPFRVRDDQVAAGWIQFTRTGLSSLRYKGKSVSFEEVLEACRKRDINFIMDLTEVYLVRKYKKSGEIPLNNTIDLYLALFAPVHIGAASEKVVYEGFDNPSYYKNAGLDGWFIAENDSGRKQIFRKRSRRDGKITIWEIYLALEAKKNRLIANYLK